jgi:hypothetical protein
MFLSIVLMITRPFLEINERFFNGYFSFEILLLRPLIEEIFVCVGHPQDQHVPNHWLYEPREQTIN